MASLDEKLSKPGTHRGGGEWGESIDTDSSITAIELIQLDPQTVRRDISAFQIIALGFNIPNSWAAIATAFSIALAAGGTVELIYGTIIVTILYGCVAVTLAELASVYPTAGGQYHFTSILAPDKVNRWLSYICGIMATVSWVVGGASVASITSSLVAAVPGFYSGYEAEAWHLFLMYQVLNLLALGYNLWVMRRTRWIHDVAFVLTLASFTAISITCLVRGEKQDSKTVWTEFRPATGWNPGVSFLTGLSTHGYMFGGIDAVLHLAEETLNASRTVPVALMSTIGIGFVSAFGFVVVMAYCITDFEELANDPVPIYSLWRTATKSDAAGTAFLIASIVIFAYILIAVQQTTSRLIWAMARDRGLLFSSGLSKLSPSLGDIPAAALVLDAFLIFVCGCISLGSTAAFNALLGSFLILQMGSFAMPAALLIYRKRSDSVLPRKRAFVVPELLGWVCSVGTIVSAVMSVFFTFPTVLPVTGANMNYSAVVLVAIGLLAAVNWFSYARKHYQGPRIELSL